MRPCRFSSRRSTLFAYYRRDADVVDGMEVQTAEFLGCLSVMFGFPNDEALHGHRLWGRGLDFYAVDVVESSRWLDELRAIERAHPNAPRDPFPEAKHFVLGFHDSTLEAVATGVIALERYTTMQDAAAAMAMAVSSALSTDWARNSRIVSYGSSSGPSLGVVARRAAGA